MNDKECEGKSSNQKAGAQIGKRALIQSVVILLLLMVVAGVLTRVIPPGSYTRTTVGERVLIDPDSFRSVERPDYPIWRWFTAPVEVLWGPDAVVVITIILFILAVGASFAVLDKSGILRAAIARVVRVFGARKYLLLLVVSFFFMLLGAMLGLFEEVIPLVPIMIALAYFLGWDSLTGLGMSILATNLGFSAAIANPFTIGVAQQIAGLPLFSGAWLRIPVFFVVYALLAVFLLRYARAIERNPQASPVYREDQTVRARFSLQQSELEALASGSPGLGRALAWFGGCLLLILLVLVSGPFLPAISDFALPIVGLLFLVAGIGAGWLAGSGGRTVLQALGEGVSGIAPGIVLILMAAAVKHIIAQGGVMDTILHAAAQTISRATPLGAAMLVYVAALVVELFIGSASAKALLMMPIMLPLADLVGLTRQVAVTAYCFGDGFSNTIYPTNPVLLIALGLTVVSYPKWIRWSLPLWLMVLVVTVATLAVAVAIHFGPF